MEDLAVHDDGRHRRNPIGLRLGAIHGADTSLRDKHGKTALRIALEDCAHAAVPLLKAVGAKV